MRTDFQRDYFLPAANNYPGRDERLKVEFSSSSNLNIGVSNFAVSHCWTPHLGRNFLPSATAALHYSMEDLNILGGWAAKPIRFGSEVTFTESDFSSKRNLLHTSMVQVNHSTHPLPLVSVAIPRTNSSMADLISSLIITDFQKGTARARCKCTRFGDLGSTDQRHHRSRHVL